MIENAAELDASLEYMIKLANALEGLRRDAQATGSTTLLPVSLEGPLAHLRENLAAIREYTEKAGLFETSGITARASVFGVGAASAEGSSAREAAVREPLPSR